MTATFEVQKNTKAASYTAVICVLLLLIAFLFKWSITVPPEVFPPDLIEVDLGNDMNGFGEVQPLVKGDPGQVAQANDSRASGAVSSASQDVDADDNDDPDAASVVKAPKKTTPANTVSTNTKPKVSTNPVSDNNAPRKPKLPLYQGGNGTGGNGATEDNGYHSQGTGGGTGDEGSPGGRIGGIRGRNNITFPATTGDFTENATVYVNITVDRSGRVTEAVIKRTTTPSGTIRNLALQKAKELKFPASDRDSETGTVIFNFKVR